MPEHFATHWNHLYFHPLQLYSSGCVVLEISRIDNASLTGGTSLYTRATCLLWRCFASVCLFVCQRARVYVCLPAIVRDRNPIRMMAAVINLIRGPLGFAVCQSDICPSCRLNSVAAFDISAPLTCNLSDDGSCGYLDWDWAVITEKHVWHRSCLLL